MVHQRHPTTPVTGTSGPHQFVEPPDARSALALASTQQSLQAATSLAVAESSVGLEDARCAMPGCGRTREDPMHWPEDEA